MLVLVGGIITLITALLVLITAILRSRGKGS